MQTQPQHEIPSEILNAFRNLIVYYIERQRLVVLAMFDLAPVLFKMNGSNVPALDLDPYIDRFMRKQGEAGPAWFLGIWKYDWKYRLHGIGCELTHIRTGEPLEWDAPNSEAFRLGWFWHHLEWRCRNERDDPFVSQVAELLQTNTVRAIVPTLESAGVIQTGVDGISILRPR